MHTARVLTPRFYALDLQGSAGNDIYKIMDPGGPDNIDTLVEGQSADVYVLRVFPLCALVPRVQGSSGAVATPC